MTAPAYGAITEVASQRASVGTAVETSHTLAFPNNVTVNNLSVVGGQLYNGGGIATISVSDTVGTIYTVVKSSSITNTIFIAYGKVAASAGNTVTVTADVDTYASFSIDEFTGVDTTTQLDVDGGESSGSDTAPGDSITTAVANALIIGVYGDSTDHVDSITEDAGYTKIGEIEDGGNYLRHALEFRIATTATAYTVSWTLASSATWQVYTVSFKPAATTTVRKHKVIVLQ